MKMAMNTTYDKNPDYNSKSVNAFGIKLPIITDFFRHVEGEIIDIGCGQGDNMRELIDSGRSVYGIDFSEVCCKKYLSDLPHECSSIIDFCSEAKEYDSALCSGVLEHITKKDLNENLSAIRNIASRFLFGIANHSDIQFGTQLHVIQEGPEWWVKRLKKHFDDVEVIDLWVDGAFFFISCNRKTRRQKTERG